MCGNRDCCGAAPGCTVLSVAFEVSNTLGSGFLEKVYERALQEELTLRGIQSLSQPKFPVHYKSRLVGEYIADFLIEDTLIVELKCATSLQPEHVAQCLNYLKASHKPICLLINFHNPKLEWRRLKPHVPAPVPSLVLSPPSP